MLERTLTKLGKKNLEVRLIYKNNLNGIAASVTWKDPNHAYTLRVDRLIAFEELYKPSMYMLEDENPFEFNLSTVLVQMAAKVSESIKNYETFSV